MSLPFPWHRVPQLLLASTFYVGGAGIHSPTYTAACWGPRPQRLSFFLLSGKRYGIFPVFDVYIFHKLGKANPSTSSPLSTG